MQAMEIVHEEPTTYVYPVDSVVRCASSLLLLLFAAVVAAVSVRWISHDPREVLVAVGAVWACCAYGGSYLQRRWVFDRTFGRVRLESALSPAHWAVELRGDLSEIRGYTLETERTFGGIVTVITLHTTDGAHELARVDARSDVVATLRPLLDVMPALSSPRASARPPAVVHPVVVAHRGECQVCGTDRNGRWVACARCETPHHEDCWSYNDLCSTYGCGGTMPAPIVVRA